MLSYYQNNEFTTTVLRPYQSADGRFTCLFQGELINGQMLRNKLEKTGVYIHSDRSEEIILELFLFSGESFAKLLRGKFAIIIYDHELHQIIAVRDRYGICRLHYKLVKNGIAFSSKLISFMPKGGWSLDAFDHTTLRHYFSGGYFPEEETFLTHVAHLPAGCLLKYDDASGLSVTPFANLLVLEGSLQQVVMKEELYDIMTESIQARLQKTDAIGIFYQGKLAELVLNTTAKLAGYDIFLFQAEFASTEKTTPHFDGRLIKRKITPEDYWKSALETTRILGLPVADPQMPVDYLLAELAQKHVDVLLSTDGAELLFGKEESSFEKLRHAKKTSIFSEKEKEAWLAFQGEKWEEFLAPYLAEISDLKQPFQKETLALNTTLKGSTVLKTETIATHFDLVTRYPFLDDQTVDIANFLTCDEKKSMNLIKQIFTTKNNRFQMPMRKKNHQIPLAKWIRIDLYEFIKALFEEEVVALFFDQEALMMLLLQHRKNKGDHSEKIWAVVIFTFWLKTVLKLNT